LRLILLNGEPVGRYDTYDSEDFIQILSISLLLEYRNKGIGSGLILHTMENAKRTNRYVSLNVMWFNSRARSLYEKLGFYVAADSGVCCEMRWKSGLN
jgi:ribosomal protein S18 acetylase RimI-like enzyme